MKTDAQLIWEAYDLLEQVGEILVANPSGTEGELLKKIDEFHIYVSHDWSGRHGN